ncbi:MAG: hypothetical protein Q9196_001420 [Gyalolechia fulgens]
MPPLFTEYDSDSTDILQANTTPLTTTAPPSETFPDSVPARKRKRSGSSESLASSANQPLQSESDIDLAEVTEKRHLSSGFVGVYPPHPVYPRSLYTGHDPSLPREKERTVLKEILETEVAKSDASDGDFISVDLEDFSVYRPHQTFSRKFSRILGSVVSEKTRANELVSLHDLNSRHSDSFIFNGTICFGDNGEHQRYVQQVSFENLSIGGYEDTNLHTVGHDIWLQSVAGKASNIWYRLRRPNGEYRRYHEPFLWLADLAKHIVDFLNAHESITLHHFRSIFAEWLETVHGSHQSFLSWRREYPRNDFRQAVAAHAGFLYNQAGQLGSRYIHHPLWGEIDPNALTAIPRRPEKRANSRTIVTPYVYDCFKHMPWAKFLDPVSSERVSDPSASMSAPKPHGSGTVLHEGNADHPTESQLLRLSSRVGEVRTGDIVAICSDQNTKWKTKDDYWYAYVQGRKLTRQGHQLDLIWIYRPADTACQDMRYPYANELFFSDHCNCGDSPVYSLDVARKVGVALFGLPETPGAEYFIRQTYSSIESHWTTLRPSDFRCRCNLGRVQALAQYNLGDTLLVKAVSPNDTLEPVVLVEKNPDGNVNKACVRRLLRKRDFGDKTAEPNELVYTERCDIRDVALIIRRCFVRFYTLDDRDRGHIPAPYNRKGAGDCYYILLKQYNPDDLEDIRMNQGFDPLEPLEGIPMRGLDIFCGGGNFGRGLEESRAVKMDWAVDFFNEAIHTYHANSEEPKKLYNGSVNDYLFDAVKGRRSQGIAGPGEVAVICAGSPCQGFSVANRLYANDRSLLNVSLVASVVAFVDFYRPKYAIMENVLGMANRGPKRTGQDNVFAQVLCALVALGYQVKPMMLDSWNFGAPQSRSRLFITAAAPGLAPLTRPPPSHSHPGGVIGRSLGRAANGLPFGVREWDATPFEYISIGEATRDLPEISDGRTACIPCPDHRVTKNLSVVDNVRLSCVPRFPPGMTFVKSAKLGLQSAPQMAAWHWDSDLRSGANSKAWQRAKSNALLPTVTTENAPSEALTGSALHWDAHRPLTVMEARRAQGFPDDEVIIGTPATQWKIIGNSVARQVAIVLGMSLKGACSVNVSYNNEQGNNSPVGYDIAERVGTILVEADVPEANNGIDRSIENRGKPQPLLRNNGNPAELDSYPNQETTGILVGEDISTPRAAISTSSESDPAAPST